jgi:chaperonin cofactor prefoldin
VNLCLARVGLLPTNSPPSERQHSASYGGEQDWEKAAADAKECIRLDPSFVKGYYRLATAQMELKDWDAATATIKQGLNIDPNNPQLTKQLRQVNLERKADAVAEKKSAVVPSQQPGMAPGGGGMSNEEMEMQQQLVQLSREYQVVQANINRAQREYRSNELTKSELEKLPEDSSSRMYRSIGKMFLLSSRPAITEHLDKSMEDDKKEEAELRKKLDYLLRRIGSVQQNLKELVQSASTAE